MVRYFTLYFSAFDVLSGFSVASATVWSSASLLAMWTLVKSEHLELLLKMPVHCPVFLNL